MNRPLLRGVFRQTDMARSSQLFDLVKNIYTLWARLPVTYISTHYARYARFRISFNDMASWDYLHQWQLPFYLNISRKCHDPVHQYIGHRNRT